MASLLDDRDITPDERAAITDEPRPGVWAGDERWMRGFAHHFDGRALSQRQTDALILGNLREQLNHGLERRELERIAGDSGPWIFLDDGSRALDQRGGIHSDPLVRLLAFRAWGERDRVWRKRDTAMAIAQPHRGYYDRERDFSAWSMVYAFDGIYFVDGVEDAKIIAQRGEREAIATVYRRWGGDTHFDQMREAYLSTFDELDAKLEAGGGPLTIGSVTFDLAAR